MRAALVATFFLLLAGAAAQAQTRLVVVSGVGGDPKYTKAFSELSGALAQAARDRGGLADSAIIWLGEPNAPKSAWYRGPSTRENLERTLARLATIPDDQQLVLVLIGHGSGEGPDTKISLPGPDPSASDFARLLTPFNNRRVAFINLTSASGDMLPVLAARNRVVMTATKSAFERNETQFGRFFIDAFARDGADTDKDGRVSLLEAFRYAETETKRFYENEGRLATEHAQIADAGQLAARFFLGGSATSAPPGSAARVTALYDERSRLDERIQALKSRKASMAAESYERELEQLLLSLALKTREIRKLERGS